MHTPTVFRCIIRWCRSQLCLFKSCLLAVRCEWAHGAAPAAALHLVPSHSNCDGNTDRQGDMCQWDTGGMFRFQWGGVAPPPQAPKTNSLRTQQGHALLNTMCAAFEDLQSSNGWKMEQRAQLKAPNVSLAVLSVQLCFSDLLKDTTVYLLQCSDCMGTEQLCD